MSGITTARFVRGAAITTAITCAVAAARADAPLGNAFTYQGQLTAGGVPVHVNVDFEFSLWDDPNSGSQLGSTVSIVDYPVVDGLFAVELDFGGQFDGNARFLEIAVRSPHDPNDTAPFTTLSPRQPLTAAPYALYALNAGGASDYWTLNGDALTNSAGDLVGIGTGAPAYRLHVESDLARTIFALNTEPSAVSHAIRGEAESTNGGGVFGWATAASGFTGGAIGRSDSTDGRGVIGFAPSTTGQTFGVYGECYSATGTGVYGLAIDASGANYGVYGETRSATGYGGYFLGEGSGIAAYAETLSGTGVFGHATGDFGTGVRGVSEGYSGIGVLGRRPNPQGTDPAVRGLTSSSTPGAIGVHGWAQDQARQGVTYGVFGESNAFFGVGVHGESNIGVEGEGRQYGVFGTASDTLGEGVRGEGTYGVWGYSDVGAGAVGEAGSSSAYGVWAIGAGGRSSEPALYADGGNGPAIYAIGNRAIYGEGDEFGVRGVTWDENGYGGSFSNFDPNGVALHVSGRAEISGTMSVEVLEILGGADLAERFEFSETAEPGMVVAIDPNQPGKLCVSREAYNERVAGVISGANDLHAGVVLGTRPADELNLPVAMSGRVWVHCDTRAAGVTPGDRLTTSDIPGYTMPVLDAAAADGAIIGKAMSSLAQGERGMVLVLVNLQ